MDDLDRLYRHLVESLRDEAPHLLDQEFTVGDLGQQLIPYRLHRRTLGFDTIQQYDQALLRLVSGERGYLRTAAAVQEAARQALGAGGDGDALRRFADAPASLAPERLGTLLGATTATAGEVTPGPGPLAPPAAAASLPGRATPASVAAPAPMSAAAPDQPPAMPFPTRPPATVTGGRCQYCGHALPEGRAVTFCPYCGQNVTLVRCPACSTELEVGWRFCVTCGRAMDGGEGRASPGAAAGP